MTITGPGFATPAVPISKNITAGMKGDKSVTVEYTFDPPGGTWDWTDNGKYSLNVLANQVFDTDPVSNSVKAAVVGVFDVGLTPPLLVVDNAGDLVNFNYSAGELTLREAMLIANFSLNTQDTITFAAALTAITLTDQIPINDPVIVTGTGVSKLTINASTITTNTSRIFDTSGAGKSADIRISDLTLNGANVNGPGGAIFVGDESATFTRLTISNNVSNTGNAANGGGGGIYINQADAMVTVRESTFFNNSSLAGGAITSPFGAGLLIESCLFTGNLTTAANSGGGVRVLGTTGPNGVFIRNSTFFNNTSGFNGGAIGVGTASAGLVVVQNCTITGNQTTNAGGGGAIGVNTGSTATLLIESSILFGNTGTAAAPELFSANLVTANNSIIASKDGATLFTGNAKTNGFLGVDPQLGTLMDNGGTTQTIAIAGTSPGRNEGLNNAKLTNDQRGPLFARNSGGAPDIGAFEIQAPVQVANIIVDDGTGQRSLVRSITVQFDNSFVLTPGAFTLNRYANGLAGTIGLVVTPMGNNVVLTFDNTGTIALDPAGSLPDGTYELTIVADNVTGTAGKLDGNKNGISDGSPTDNVSSKLHRLFGDVNGDGSVTAIEFNLFRLDYGSPGPSIFDFDGIGGVSAIDFNNFRLRYGQTMYQP